MSERPSGSRVIVRRGLVSDTVKLSVNIPTSPCRDPARHQAPTSETGTETQRSITSSSESARGVQ